MPREPDALIEIIVDLRDENGKLRAMLETARRALYVARSERLGEDPGQLAFGLGDISAASVASEPDGSCPVTWCCRVTAVALDGGGSPLSGCNGGQSDGWTIADGSERIKAHVAALDSPLVILLQQDGPDQASNGRLVWEYADNVPCAA